MDVYRDYFTREELVKVLAKTIYTPGLLGTMNLFEPTPVASTEFGVEVQAKEGGKILTEIVRGGPRTQTGLVKDNVVTFTTKSYGDQGAVMADEVLKARARGVDGARAIIEARRARLVKRLRAHIDRTAEYLRMQALLSPATTEFGAAAAPVVIAVQTDTTKLRQEIFNKIILPLEAEMDGDEFTMPVVLCSNGYWADLIESKSMKDTYLATAQADQLRKLETNSFVWGDVIWQRYRGDSQIAIPANEARAIPGGVSLGYAAYAPNDTIESVGAAALGQPYYMGSKPIEDSQGTKGWEVSIASHMKMVVNRPGAILPITKT